MNTKTELFEMDRTERQTAISSMSTDRLFAELDDTIQFDVLGMNNVEYTGYRDQLQVYYSIVSELRNRLLEYERDSMDLE